MTILTKAEDPDKIKKILQLAKSMGYKFTDLANNALEDVFWLDMGKNYIGQINNLLFVSTNNNYKAIVTINNKEFLNEILLRERRIEKQKEFVKKIGITFLPIHTPFIDEDLTKNIAKNLYKKWGISCYTLDVYADKFCITLNPNLSCYASASVINQSEAVNLKTFIEKCQL